MTETEADKTAWKQCLELWKQMSKLSDTRQCSHTKMELVQKIAGIYVKHGCPFCHVHVDMCFAVINNKTGRLTCPIAIEFNRPFACEHELGVPYSRWSDGNHTQAVAKEFYLYLRQLHKRTHPKKKVL